MQQTLRSLAPSCVLAFLFAGCSTETIYVTVVRCGAVDLTRHGTIAVDDFAGNGGADLTEEVIVRLARAPAAGASGRRVDIVDRRNFEKILRELSRQRGDMWDPDTITRLGKLAGARALVHGRVSANDYDEAMSREEWQDNKGNRHVTFKRTGTAHIAAYVQVADTETGKLLDTVRYDEREEDWTSATDAQPAPIDGTALLATARGRIADDFVRRVLPYAERVPVSLFVDGDFPDLKVGNNFAAVGTWDKALESYQRALDAAVGPLAEYRYMALYNMGVAYEYLARFDEARTALREAYALSEDGIAMEELANVDQREADHKRLSAPDAEGAAP